MCVAISSGKRPARRPTVPRIYAPPATPPRTPDDEARCVIIGVLFLVAGVQELFMASIAPDWKWLWILFGVLFLIAGVWALVNPIRTFVAVAEMLGFLFVLIGVFWTIEAFATRPVNDLWFLGLVAGIMMVVLGFWTGGQFIVTRASLLLTFVGIWALFHGITDLIRAFRIRHLGQHIGALGAG